jgi:hypothetical protein
MLVMMNLINIFNNNKHYLMKKINFLLLLFCMTSAVFSQPCTFPVNAVVYYVDIDTDGGPGSLRQAILDANSSNIGGAVEINGPFTTLYLNAPLPEVTCDSLFFFDFVPVVIDGLNMVPEPGITILSETSCLGPNVTGINFLNAVFTVTNTNNSGAGSLKDMIQRSNFTSSADAIHFNIPGAAPHEIITTTELPLILKPVTIDGSSQPANGYGGTAPKIRINGVTGNIDGLNFYYTNEPGVYNAAVYGMQLINYDHAVKCAYGQNFTVGGVGKKNVIGGCWLGIETERNRNLLIEHNYIGTDTSSAVADANNFGISVVGDPLTVEMVRNNVISGNISIGVELFSVNNFTFSSNLVGTDATGTIAVPNQNACLIGTGKNITIGGSTPGTGNLFSGNGVAGPPFPTVVVLDADSSKITGNMFGTNLAGTDTIPNKATAINFRGQHVVIGGTFAAERNIISSSVYGVIGNMNPGGIILNNYFGTDINGNQDFPNIGNIYISNDSVIIRDNLLNKGNAGIELYGDNNEILLNEIRNSSGDGILNTGDRNRYYQNSIYGNAGLGINNYFGNNNGILPPVFTFIDTVSAEGTALPGAVIELFYSQSTDILAQGKIYIGTTIADAAGNWQYAGTITDPLLITTTQTDTQNNTSEFTVWPSQTAANVWPGDCNYDLVADNLDFIYLGMANGITGIPRNSATISWTAQPAANWNYTFSNYVNCKHADCDGNGAADMSDSTAILQNYSLTHPYRQQQSSLNVIYDFYLEAINDTVAPGGYASFTIHAGNNSFAIPQIYGIAWSFLFDALLADTANINYDYAVCDFGTWHTDMETFVKPFYASGSADLAITKINQTEALIVDDVIGVIHIKTKPSISTIETFHAYPQLAAGLRLNGEAINFNLAGDSVVIDPQFTYIANEIQSPEILIYPNPASTEIIVKAAAEINQVDIIDLSGHVLRSEFLTAKNAGIKISDIKPGLYTVKIRSAEKVTYRKIVITD